MAKGNDPPPPPDPNEIAQAEARYNRIDQFTPFGNLTYSGPDRNQATLSLSPEVQGIVDQRFQTDQSLLAEALQRFPSIQSQPIDLSQFGQIQSDIDRSGFPELNVPQIQSQINAPDLQNAAVNPFEIQNAVDLGLNTSGLPNIPQDVNAYRGDVEEAVFERGRALLDPVFSDRERALEQRLANQGLPTSGEAYDRDVERFQREQNRAYGDLANQAVITGGREASRQLGDVLSARGQGFGEQVTGANLNLAGGQFGNQAAQQALSQALAQGEFANRAGLSEFGADLQAANFANQAGLLGLGASQNVRGQLQGEAQQSLQNQNAARAQALAEAQGVRGNQFNELASLLGLQQVQAPQVGNFFQPGQANVTGAYGLNQQAAQNAYNAQLGQNSAMMSGLFGLGGAALNSPWLGGLMGGGGGGGGGSSFPMWASDRRLKRDIHPIGDYRGLKVYAYRYLWNDEWRAGVMSDEVPQDAVHKVGGYDVVDYEAIDALPLLRLAA